MAPAHSAADADQLFRGAPGLTLTQCARGLPTGTTGRAIGMLLARGALRAPPDSRAGCAANFLLRNADCFGPAPSALQVWAAANRIQRFLSNPRRDLRGRYPDRRASVESAPIAEPTIRCCWAAGAA
jgi:hypothetical protein